MKRAILVDTDSAGGAMKQARIADPVLAAGLDVIDYPAPNARDVVGFFHERHSMLSPRTDIEPESYAGRETGPKVLAFLDEAEKSDRLELWFGPSIASQLSLCLLIDTIAKRPALAAKTVLVLLEVELGAQTPDWVRTLAPEFAPLTANVRRLASEAWSAFCASTPEPWRGLVDTNLLALPRLGPEARRLLDELPDAQTGLSATQLALLKWIERKPAKLLDVLAGVIGYRMSPFGYWRLGEILLDLFAAPTPAATGTTERVFDLEMHQDTARHRAFCKTEPRLTPFGEALMRGEADWVGANPIDRWLGGTHLTSGNLWRWDMTERRLIAPA